VKRSEYDVPKFNFSPPSLEKSKVVDLNSRKILHSSKCHQSSKKTEVVDVHQTNALGHPNTDTKYKYKI